MKGTQLTTNYSKTNTAESLRSYNNFYSRLYERRKERISTMTC